MCKTKIINELLLILELISATFPSMRLQILHTAKNLNQVKHQHQSKSGYAFNAQLFTQCLNFWNPAK